MFAKIQIIIHTKRFMRTLFLILLLLAPFSAHTEEGIISLYVPHAKASGYGKLSMFFGNAYDVTLYAPKGKWQADKPYAIAISYLREIKGIYITNYTVTEIRRQGFKNEQKLAVWKQLLQNLFADVEYNTTMIGVRSATGSTIFYRDNKSIGMIEDKEFSGWFFGIWLHETTSYPALRKKLLGI